MDVVDEILSAGDKVVRDFGRHSKSEYFSSFAPEATFLFHTHPARLESRQEYESLWDSWEVNDGFRVLACTSKNQRVQVIDNRFAIFTRDVETKAEFSGVTSTTFEKETIVFVLEGDNWVAVHEHLSPALS